MIRHDCTTTIMADVTLVKFMIENFPKNIFNSGLDYTTKEYTSVLDFITDIMKSLGISPMEMINLFLGAIVNMSGASFTDFENGKKALEKLDEDLANCPWLKGIEDTIKYIIAIALSGPLSCSAMPIIEDRLFDAHYYVKNNSGEDTLLTEGGVILKLSELDPFGYLNLCPTSIQGKGYYFDNEYGINELYKSRDFNAFLWYVIHRSNPAPQKEVNMCMWDNCYTLRYKRTKWEDWLNSKTGRYYDAYSTKPKSSNPTCLYDADNPKVRTILQLKNVSTTPEPSILVQISSQEYFKNPAMNIGTGGSSEGVISWGLNKTMAEFNADYLKSVRLFSVKAFVSGILDGLFNTVNVESLSWDNISAYFKSQKIPLNENFIRTIVKKTIKNISSGTDTCYFTFSNEEYDQMLRSLDLKKYNILDKSENSNSLKQIDINKYNEIKGKLVSPDNDENLTLEETITQLEEVIIDENGENKKLNDNEKDNWFEDFIYILVFNVIKPIFSPKVIFLLYLNNEIMGIDKEITLEKIIENLIQMVISIIKEILKSFIEMALGYILENLTKYLVSYMAMRLLDIVNDYIELLYLAYATCIPSLRPIFYTGGIDDVDYADITPEKITPETNKC